MYKKGRKNEQKEVEIIANTKIINSIVSLHYIYIGVCIVFPFNENSLSLSPPLLSFLFSLSLFLFSFSLFVSTPPHRRVSDEWGEVRPHTHAAHTLGRGEEGEEGM